MIVKKEDTLQVALKFFSDKRELEFLSKYLGIECYDNFSKGESFFSGPPHNRVKKNRENYFWENRVIFRDPNFFMNLITQYIKERIILKQDEISNLGIDIEKQLYISMQLYEEWTPSVFLKPEEMAVIGNLGISLDIDLYFFGTKSPAGT